MAGEFDSLGRLAKRAAILMLPLALAACFGSDGDRPSLMEGGRPEGLSRFPTIFVETRWL
jgi:hypothetical protein